jgi:PAS domain S-box-containing protein
MRQGSLRSLRVQLTAAFVAVGLIPTLVLGAFGLYLILAQVRQDANVRNQQIALAIAGEVRRYLESQLLALRLIELGIESGDLDAPGELQRHVALLRQANPAMKTVLVLDDASRVVQVVPPDPDALGMDLSRQPFVRDARARREPTWSSATMSMQRGLPVVALTVPGSRFAVVGYLDLEALERIVERTAVGPTGEAAVIDRDGTVIAHRDRRLVREQVNVRDLTVIREALEGRAGTAEYALGGRPFLGSAAPVEPTNWVVLASEPLDTAFAQAERLRTVLLVVFGAALALAVGSGLVSARRILKPIDALAGRARRIEEGEYAKGPEAHGGPVFPEIDALSHSFDTMAEAVAEREEALARSERNYRSLVSAPVVGVLRTHIDGTILFANEAFARLLGRTAPEELLGRSMLETYRDPSDRARIVASLQATGKAANFEVPMLTASGEERIVLVNSAREGEILTSVLVDITELRRAAADRERLEQELLHAQKLEAVGRLAGSVAHDFNNLLTAILSHAALLEAALPPGAPAREDVDGIVQSAQRAAHLTRSLLAYGRKQTLRKQAVDLREVVRAVEPLVRRLLHEGVDLSLSLPDERLGVVADATQLEQVLVNLCTNARDAMPGGGEIAISARRVDLSDREASAAGVARGGPFARVDVRDTGGGIAPDVQRRIFEPFFTTKEASRGTGLGLAIVDGIVRQHGGHVAVASLPGAGTVFSFFLPAVDAVEKAPVERPAAAPTPGGRETILLAEDEPSVRRALRAALERAGYAVIEAVDGADAVRQFEAHRERVDLCLLDVRMPGLNGREAYEAISGIRPGVRTLFASGFTADILDRGGDGSPLPEFVAKPIAPADLLRKVRQVLDGGAHPVPRSEP